MKVNNLGFDYAQVLKFVMNGGLDMSSSVGTPHYFYNDFLSFLMLQLISMNMIIRSFTYLVIRLKDFYLPYLVPSLIL